MTNYGYETLDPSRKQIRLVRIESRVDPEAPIECTMETFDYCKWPKYEALSYTWGSPDDMETILVNGCDLKIRRNLWDFLDGVSKARFSYLDDFAIYETGYLWIDQISINQSAVEEKNQQVRRIGYIFAEAENVIIWLGPGTSETEDALASCKPKAEACESSIASLAIMTEHRRTIFSQPYWTRLWVVQECLLARQLVVIYGRRWIFWDEFCDSEFLRFDSDFGSVYIRKEATPSYGRCAAIDFVAAIQSTRSSTDLMEGFGMGRSCLYAGLEQTLEDYAHLDCADPRDKVYGLMAVVEPSPLLDIDYSRPASLIFWDAVTVLAKPKSIGYPRSEWLLELGKAMGVTGEEPNAISFVKSVIGGSHIARFAWPNGWHVREAAHVNGQALRERKRRLHPVSPSSFPFDRASKHVLSTSYDFS